MKSRTDDLIRRLGPDQIRELLRPHIPDISRINGRTAGKVQCFDPTAHNHGDRDPSLFVNLSKGYLKCYSQGCFEGNFVDFLGKMRGRSWNEVMAELEGNGALRHDRKDKPTLTACEYARAKRLPEKFLRTEFHLDDQDGQGIAMPYLDSDGNQMFVRHRLAMQKRGKGDLRFLQPKGVKLEPYGLWRVTIKDRAIIVEGESDTQTLHYHAYRECLGMPGATVFKKEWVRHVAAAVRIYALVDADTAGEQFLDRIAWALKTAGFTGVLYAVRLQGAKDVSELHCADPEAFRNHFDAALADAKQINFRDKQKTLPAGVSDAEGKRSNDEAESTSEADLTSRQAGPYRIKDGGIFCVKQTHETEVEIPLTNFVARIRAEVTIDDGVETSRQFEIEADVSGQRQLLTIGAGEFSSMKWVPEKLGVNAVLFAGFGAKDHARAAIQLFSKSPEMRTIYTHTGWRNVSGQLVYLHGSGAIGPDGALPEVSTRLPEPLRAYELPIPPAGTELRSAVHATLDLLELGPSCVMIPIVATVYRSVLGSCDFAVHLTGGTDAFKTELAALAQCHFGRGFCARNLPASWASTGNQIETLAFFAKDALLVVDDFAPNGTPSDIARLHRQAERLLRAQGNRSGRGRLGPDGSLLSVRPPRGLVLSTGEEIPRGKSLRARMLIVEIAKGAIGSAALSKAQKRAEDGKYSAAISGYVHWLAPRIARIQRGMFEEVHAERQRIIRGASHRRASDIAAHLIIGLRWFLRFASDVGAVDRRQTERMLAHACEILGQLVNEQAEHTVACDPVDRFSDLLSAALAAGHVHIASPTGGSPPAPFAAGLGWRRGTEAASHGRLVWNPCGDRIGWFDGTELMLNPSAAYRAAERMAGQGGEGIQVGAKTLWKRCSERGLVRSAPEEKRQTQRRTIEGRRQRVIVCGLDILCLPESDQPGRSDLVSANAPKQPVLQPDSSNGTKRIEPKTEPSVESDTHCGSVGPIGPVFRTNRSNHSLTVGSSNEHEPEGTERDE